MTRIRNLTFDQAIQAIQERGQRQKGGYAYRYTDQPSRDALRFLRRSLLENDGIMRLVADTLDPDESVWQRIPVVDEITQADREATNWTFCW